MSETIKTCAERQRAKTLEGVGVGALTGGALGVFLSVLVPAWGGTPPAVVLCTVAGLFIGAVLGRWITDSVIAETLEPGMSGRDYVGAHAPDVDERERAAGRRHRVKGKAPSG